MSIGKEKQDFKNFLRDYTVQSLRPLLTHINKEVKISGIRLMKKDIIIDKISELYSSNRKLSNGVIVLSPKSINVGNINLDVIKEKVQKEVIKKKVVKEVVKDVVKQATKKGIKPTKKEKVIIEKKVKDVVEKKKPAPNKKIKEHINKVEKKIIKKKKLTKKELEEIERKKKDIDEAKADKLRMEGEELLQKNKGLLKSIPTNRNYPGGSQNRYQALWNLLSNMSSSSDFTGMLKRIKEEILKIKKDKLKKMIKK